MAGGGDSSMALSRISPSPLHCGSQPTGALAAAVEGGAAVLPYLTAGFTKACCACSHACGVCACVCACHVCHVVMCCCNPAPMVGRPRPAVLTCIRLPGRLAARRPLQTLLRTTGRPTGGGGTRCRRWAGSRLPFLRGDDACARARAERGRLTSYQLWGPRPLSPAHRPAPARCTWVCRWSTTPSTRGLCAGGTLPSTCSARAGPSTAPRWTSSRVGRDGGRLGWAGLPALCRREGAASRSAELGLADSALMFHLHDLAHNHAPGTRVTPPVSPFQARPAAFRPSSAPWAPSQPQRPASQVQGRG